MIKKVCHMTSAHDWNDDRIFLKECQSLASAGYEVYLVAEGINREECGVHIIGCGEKPTGRRERMGRFAEVVYQKSRALDCDVYHFHDPELLPYGVKLKKAGKNVVFDSHEDVPGQILDKEWIPWILRKVISIGYKMYETHCVKCFDAVVAATPHIADIFVNRAQQRVIINNYPKLDDIIFQKRQFQDRPLQACYAGSISEIRGETVMVAAMDGVEGQLIMAGSYDSEDNVNENLSNVKYLGRVSRKEVNELYGNSRVGIVLYQPAKNHYESQPVKMFEYMAAGLPVVASDFPHWKDIVENTGCGICVNPTDANEVRKAIQELLSNAERAQKMGELGNEAAINGYNWNVEEKKLIALYKEFE